MRGDRIHQWIGARYHENDGFYRRALPDIDRIHRQQIFLKEFLERDFSFSKLNLEKQNLSNAEAIRQLGAVDSRYEMEIMKFNISVVGPAVLLSKKDYIGMLYFTYKNLKRTLNLLLRTATAIGKID